MFYRRKVLLALLETFDGRLEKIAMQKLLFLLTTRQTNPTYDFIPLHFGSYSISANADLNALVRKNILSKDERSFKKLDMTSYIDQLKPDDRTILLHIKQRYGKLSNEELMKFTYTNFHYYAINSKTAKKVLNKSDYEKVLSSKPKSTKTILFTLGYEGISLEEYLNRLIKNNVKVLVDVRFNAVSRKFGFSKNQIRGYCENLNIEYEHIPELGIRSEYRKELIVQRDYVELFDKYKSETLKKTRNYQLHILKLIQKKRRIALTCFESELNRCHRNHLANSLIEFPGWKFELRHI